MDIYVELSRKQLQRLNDGDWKMDLPGDVTVTRKARACYLEVDDNKELIRSVEDVLDDLGVSWQEIG
jgi:hypothetical protein